MAKTRKTVQPKAKVNSANGSTETPEWGFAFGGQALEQMFPGYGKLAANLGNQFGQAQAGSQAFGPNDFAELGKENMDAVYASGEAAVKGAEGLRKNFDTYAQRTLERNVQVSSSLLKCKDLQQAAELQFDYYRDFLNGFFLESAKFINLATKSSEATIEPLNSQAQAVYSRFANS
jgi:hypothetical protein